MSPDDLIEYPAQPGEFGRRALIDALVAAGSPWVNSLTRLYAEQKAAYDNDPSLADNPDADWLPLAHMRGTAADIDPTPDRIAALTRAGLVRPYAHEPWHWQLPGDVRRYPIIHTNPLEEDMLDADRDYAAFATMLQRALKYDARPLGVGADAKLGPTVFEQIDRIPARVWDADITAQDADGYPLNQAGQRAKPGEKTRTYKAWGYLASAVAQVSALRATLRKKTDA